MVSNVCLTIIEILIILIIKGYLFAQQYINVSIKIIFNILRNLLYEIDLFLLRFVMFYFIYKKFYCFIIILFTCFTHFLSNNNMYCRKICTICVIQVACEIMIYIFSYIKTKYNIFLYFILNCIYCRKLEEVMYNINLLVTVFGIFADIINKFFIFSC